MEPDYIDTYIAEWRRERPDLDATPMGIIARIGRLSRLFDAALLVVFSKYGVTSGEFEVLTALRRAGRPYQLSPSELARAMLLSAGAMTNRIDRLVEAGLVERTADPADRRGSPVHLSTAGLTLVDRAIADHFANEQRLLERLTPDEQDELGRLLRTLLRSFEQRARPHED